MGLNITIIDYGLGNLGSLSSSLTKIGIDFQISSDHDIIEQSDALIIPGVGSFDRGITQLKENKLFSFIKELATQGKPILGICLGMQLLFETSEESIMNIEGLGLLQGSVRKFPKNRVFTIPHVGWNFVRFNKLFNECSSDYYFVHSFYCDAIDEKSVIGITEYEQFQFVSSVQKKNIFGFQFHPEKSGQIGRELLISFFNYVKKKNYPYPYSE